MLKNNAALLQFKAQFLANEGGKTESGTNPQPASRKSKPAPQKSRPVAKKAEVKAPAPKVEEPRAIVKNHGFLLTDTYVGARNEILSLARKHWGKAGTADRVQSILVDVMLKLGVDAANKLIAETKLNKVGWRFHATGATTEEEATEEAA